MSGAQVEPEEVLTGGTSRVETVAAATAARLQEDVRLLAT
jgi:hypothetical protein